MYDPFIHPCWACDRGHLLTVSLYLSYSTIMLCIILLFTLILSASCAEWRYRCCCFYLFIYYSSVRQVLVFSSRASWTKSCHLPFALWSTRWSQTPRISPSSERTCDCCCLPGGMNWRMMMRVYPSRMDTRNYRFLRYSCCFIVCLL